MLINISRNRALVGHFAETDIGRLNEN